MYASYVVIIMCFAIFCYLLIFGSLYLLGEWVQLTGGMTFMFWSGGIHNMKCLPLLILLCSETA